MFRSYRRVFLIGLVVLLMVSTLLLWSANRTAEVLAPPSPLLVVTPAASARALLTAVVDTPDEWVVASATALAPEPESVPELADSDVMVRRFAAGLSARPEFASWLVSKGLIRRFVAATQDVAGGYSPREEFDFLKPAGAFLVQNRERRMVIAPSSCRRYDTVAEVFASLDSNGLLLLYGKLEPLIEEAYRELPWTRGEFADVLLEAMDHLLATPVPDTLPAVERGTLHWVYADNTLEQLSDAQRHLLRMGPRNAKVIQAKLRELHRVFAPDEPLPTVNPQASNGGAFANAEVDVGSVSARYEVWPRQPASMGAHVTPGIPVPSGRPCPPR